MESVAAERLNKLGKNPSIISTRHDLKRDAAVLKDIITRATPLPSSNSDEETSSLSSSSRLSLSSNEELNDYQNNLNKKRRKKRSKRKRKSSSSDKKFQKLSRLFLAAPSPTTLNSTTFDQNTNQLRKSPSTPWSLFRKSGSQTPSLFNQPTS